MHESIDTLALARHIAELNMTARRAGIEIELRTNFGHLMELCETLPDKPTPTAMFDPMKADIGGHNGFWLKGCDPNGVPVHVQAARVYDINGTNLAREFSSLRAFYASPGLAYALGADWLSDRDGPFRHIRVHGPRLAGLCLIATGAAGLGRVLL